MKKLASTVRRGNRILIKGVRHVAVANALNTFGGVTVASVPDADRNAPDTMTEFGHNDDVELW
jgi:hypothetical protein